MKSYAYRWIGDDTDIGDVVWQWVCDRYVWNGTVHHSRMTTNSNCKASSAPDTLSTAVAAAVAAFI